MLIYMYRCVKFCLKISKELKISFWQAPKFSIDHYEELKKTLNRFCWRIQLLNDLRTDWNSHSEIQTCIRDSIRDRCTLKPLPFNNQHRTLPVFYVHHKPFTRVLMTRGHSSIIYVKHFYPLPCMHIICRLFDPLCLYGASKALIDVFRTGNIDIWTWTSQLARMKLRSMVLLRDHLKIHWSQKRRYCLVSPYTPPPKTNRNGAAGTLMPKMKER
jgi:hypothetical protein